MPASDFPMMKVLPSSLQRNCSRWLSSPSGPRARPPSGALRAELGKEAENGAGCLGQTLQGGGSLGECRLSALQAEHPSPKNGAAATAFERALIQRLIGAITSGSSTSVSSSPDRSPQLSLCTGKLS